MDVLYQSNVKGTGPRDGYFFESLNILISTFCVCADGFQGLSKAFHYPVQLLFELDISLDLDDRDIVFSSPVSSILSEEKKKEADDDLEKIADRLVATLNAACSKKKKKKR